MVHALQHAQTALLVQPSSPRYLRSTHISYTDPSSIANPRRVYFPGARPQDALDRLERYDNKLFEHDINNKRFNLEALRAHKEVLGAVLGVTALVGVAAISPEARKTLIKNAPKALTTGAKHLLPGA